MNMKQDYTIMFEVKYTAWYWVVWAMVYLRLGKRLISKIMGDKPMIKTWVNGEEYRKLTFNSVFEK
jgi:hypothetical protein